MPAGAEPGPGVAAAGGGAARAHRGPLPLPANALVVLVGASGSGKSTWAGRHFAPTQVVSSDACRALVADDETDQTVHAQAFAVFHEIIRRRLELGRLTVADSTALSPVARERLRERARRSRVPCIAVVFRTPVATLHAQNLTRERRVPEAVLERHAAITEELVVSGALEAEGFDAVFHIAAPDLPTPLIGPPWCPLHPASLPRPPA